jgi:CBS domain-containing protein
MNLTEDSNKLAMVARDLISDLIPPLRTSDTGEKALAWMEEFKVAHLPIVNNVDFLGLISESDILDMNDPAGAIGNHSLSLYRPYVYDYQHIYDVLKVLSTQKLSLIPVLDENEKVSGQHSSYFPARTFCRNGFDERRWWLAGARTQCQRLLVSRNYQDCGIERCQDIEFVYFIAFRFNQT